VQLDLENLTDLNLRCNVDVVRDVSLQLPGNWPESTCKCLDGFAGEAHIAEHGAPGSQPPIPISTEIAQSATIDFEVRPRELVAAASYDGIVPVMDFRHLRQTETLRRWFELSKT
jgi:hypothetical protein